LTGEPSMVRGEPLAIARIVRILLDKAGHYGSGRVTVTVGPGTLEVSDEGPGIAEDERDAVFRRFARGHAAGSSAGAGLGLAIARGLARAMGGELSIAPSAVGARFVLT